MTKKIFVLFIKGFYKNIRFELINTYYNKDKANKAKRANKIIIQNCFI